MPSYTANHQLSKWAEGELDWQHRDDMDKLDRAVEIRDVESALSDYEPKDGAKFVATDTHAVYLGDGSSWTGITYKPTQDHINDTSNPHSVTATQASALPDTGGIVTGDVTIEGGVTAQSADIASDSQWTIHETVGLEGSQSVDIDVSGYSDDVYRIEFHDVIADTSSSTLNLRVNGNSSGGYSYISIGAGLTATTDVTEFSVSDPLRHVSDQSITGFLELYPNTWSGTNGRVHAFGMLSSGYTITDDTLYRGINFNETSGLSTITLMTDPSDSVVFGTATEVVLLGRTYY